MLCMLWYNTCGAECGGPRDELSGVSDAQRGGGARVTRAGMNMYSEG